MTVNKAIERLDSLFRNAYSAEDKLIWLSRADWMVKRHIIDLHEGGEAVEYNDYTAEDQDKELLVPPPHDDMYIRFMESQIHYNNGEYDRYNNAITEYQAAFEAYAAMYTREHMPIKAGKRFVF